MKRRTKMMTASVVTIAAVLVIAWSARMRVARDLVDRELTAAQVPASYRITRIGPFLQRLEDVRIGDPAAPDLIARRIDVIVGYGLTGPYVRGVDIDGARLHAKLGANGVSLGSIDRLLPKSRSGGAVLPDLGVALHDTHVSLDTPNGRVETALGGSGNPARLFRGTAKVSAGALRFAACQANDIGAELRLTARSGAPSVTGPLRIGHISCPGQALGRGVAALNLSADPTFKKLSASADLEGFGGHAGPARFAGVSAHAAAKGRFDALDASAELTLHAFSLPTAAHAVASGADRLAGTPLGPTSAQASAALARLLGKAEMKASIGLVTRGSAPDVRVRRIAVTDEDGAHITVVERGGLRWGGRGSRADADLSTGGGALPALTLAVRQSAPGQPITAAGALATYRAGGAALGAAPIRLRWDKAGVRFNTVALIDGPLANGAVRGLSVPITGMIRPSGAFVIGEGCEAVAYSALRLASYNFGPARVQVCGSPIVARTAAGALVIDATTAPVSFAGRTASGEPVTLAAARLTFAGQRFTLDRLEAAIGPAERRTRLGVASLDGTIASAGIEGTFGDTSAAIANVPLALNGAAGQWSFGRGALKLSGALRISDAAQVPRFFPLAADSATLRLEGSTITARAELREPGSGALVANVDLTHDLTRGSGHALLAVPGLHFERKALQPETLTPLTLGVIADVSGTITGAGRIDWSGKGVTSSGEFRTDRIDLAAAFGPVTGIRGTLRFTDLLGLVSAPRQEVTIAEMNPGVLVAGGVVHYQLTGADRIQVEDAVWPFAGGTIRLEPGTLDFARDGSRRLTFRVDNLDAGAFIQQLDFPNIAATGIFDGKLPMVFDDTGGRIEGGMIVARPGGGSLAYVGEISNAQLGTMGKLAFDALKAIRYSALDIGLDGRLDGEMVSRVRFTGVREATPEQSLVTRLIRNLPFRFNIEIRAPFRGLVGSARAYIDPNLLLRQLPRKPDAKTESAAGAKPVVQSPASAGVR